MLLTFYGLIFDEFKGMKSTSKNFIINVPKPCHEDWDEMTPKDKGRFCKSCSKTVVDFTKMNAAQVQNYFKQNWGKSVCGHFYTHQVGQNGIIIQFNKKDIPRQLPFYKMFLLALFIAMGTTLFSCKSETGDKVVIDRIEVIKDTIQEIDSAKVSSVDKKNHKTDSLKNCKPKLKDSLQKDIPPLPLVTTGITEVETLGEVQYIPDSIELDTIQTKQNVIDSTSIKIE